MTSIETNEKYEKYAKEELARIFYKVKEHLLKQNKKSTFIDGLGERNCAYRGQDGTSCAAGCLINDEFYDPMMEMKPINTPEFLHALEMSGVNCKIEDMIPLLQSLQNIHDAEYPDRWEEALELRRIDFNLPKKK